ncbi:MAG: hypothetical protein V7695_15955 [Sulfitobacter sp.]
MDDQMTAVEIDGLIRLQSAACDFACAEIARITETVIADLQSREAIGLFGDVAARHWWDEYRWNLQEGNFDDDEYVFGQNLGSISGNWDDTVRAVVQGEVEKLPRYALIFLSARAFEEDGNSDEDESVGSIWVDGVVDMVMEEIKQRGSQGNLGLIGHHRGDVIGYEIEGSGMVWSILSERGEAMDLIAGKSYEMIDPDGDLSELADEMVEAFMAAAAEDNGGEVFFVFLEYFEDQVRSLAYEEVLSSLEDMRTGLLERLDK